MSPARKYKLQILDRLERRFRRSRPGSVLILVVALLVLLALLGTAYINTAQTDRYSSAQNSFNTEIDLLLEGVEQITESAVVNGLYGYTTANFKPPTTPPVYHYPEANANGNSYALTDYPYNSQYPNNSQSAFIADRYPTLLNLSLAPTDTTGSNPPMWQFITSIPTINNFESPYVVSGTSPQTYTARTQMFPTSLPINQSTGGVLNFPALIYKDSTSGNYFTELAADADDDGIADCALFRLSVGQINGVTYYGGVRIVDNSAAINAAIAWQPNTLPVANGTIPGNFYPDNLNLSGLLASSDNLTNLNTNYRFAGAANPSLTPFDERETVPSPPPAAAPTTAVQRTDFNFGNYYEAFWMQLGRRIANPGYISGSTPYKALPLSEMQTMARKFILHDPSITAATSSSSTLEQDLPNSVFANAPSTSYQPNQSLQWYTQNFDFVNGTNLPIRSMLVTQNAVSNFTFSKLYSRGAYAAGTYNFGDWVFNSSTNGGDNRSYVCLQQTTTAPDPTNPSNPYWEREPWVTSPTKVSANTATFGQLWLGYFSAMSKTITTTPVAAQASQTAIIPTVGNPQNAMFRSSARSSATTLSAQQMILLRSALAAVNTMDLRDTDDDVTSRQIVIPDTTGAPAFNVMVYGTEKEPFITEVYASNDTGGSPNDYIAIELYNPYSTPISLLNWQLGAISRTGSPSTLTITPIGTATTASWASASTAPVIGPGAYLVLVNTLTPPSYVITKSAAPTLSGSPPTASAPNGGTLLVTGLENAFNTELVILRPRNANGTFSSSASPTNTYTESAANLNDLVPVDSYDFTGLLQADIPNPDPGHEWHYIRPSLASAYKAWHFVYPGTYNPAAGTSGDNPRQSGTQHGTAQSLTDLSSLGVGDASTVNPYIDRPLQIANQDFGGPKTVGNYPYGGFARNADLLQVTYIGAYRIESVSSNQIVELNPVTLDSAMANDPNLDNDTNAMTSEQYGRQNIGRFCPIHWADTLMAGTPPTPVNTTGEINTAGTSLYDDYGYPYVGTPAAPTAPAYWPTETAYHWTHHLFEFVTVQAPHDDYLPDVDPLKYTTAPGATPVANSNYLVANAGYTVNLGTTPQTLNTAETNDPASATEEAAPVHGRININTANWRVLATLPLFDNPPNQGADNDMARAIVYYRDIDDGTTPGTLHPHGPFQSIEELNNVPVTGTTNPMAPTVLTAPGTTFRNAFGQYTATTFPIPGLHGSNADGDLSPFNAAVPTNPGGDQVYGDFENQNLALNRISNLITTRSDSFTAYLIVQGWRNVGGASPQLVVQRRAAIIIDRSMITPGNNVSPSVNNVPVN